MMLPHIYQQSDLYIPIDKIVLEGRLSLPENPCGLVLFAHGSGSSRFSPRNTMVANFLNEHEIGTLLFDLLTPFEDRLYSNRFDIDLLANRLKKVKDWLRAQEECADLPVAYFGASTGAAAALLAAANDKSIAAVVSRGGRPDLAMESLPFVQAPTMLIVGSLDTQVLHLNQKAYDVLGGEKQMQIVLGASHLFEESGTMERVCEIATAWFEQHFPKKLIS